MSLGPFKPGDIVFCVEDTFYSQQMPLKFQNVGELREHLTAIACRECEGYCEFKVAGRWYDCEKCDGTGFKL